MINKILSALYRHYSLEPIIYRFSLAPFTALILLTKEVQLQNIIDSTTIIEEFLLYLVEQIPNNNIIFQNYLI